VLASPDIRDGDLTVSLCVILLAAYSALRTWRPLRYDRSLAAVATLMGETACTALAVALTGHWESPLVFSMLTAVSLAGFAKGFGFAVRLAIASVLAVSLAWGASQSGSPDKARTSAQWAGEIVLVAFVAGFARRISGEADERRVQALDRLGRLNDANVLLFQLHQVTQTLPASLDLEEVLDTTLDQVRDLFDASAVALLLHDDAEHRWHTARRLGGPPARSYPEADLPEPLARAARLRSATRDGAIPAGDGLDPSAHSGLYAVLVARGATIGLLALEHQAADHFTDRDVELMSGFVDPVALAIDNARWFERLRTVGAAEERTRIARELHDRIGQSLAYVAFELDRLTKKAGAGGDIAGSLDGLRTDVRGVIGELRDTLYDLRTEVTLAEGLGSVLPAFLERVEARSGLQVSSKITETGRLPILQERELWRIAQELVGHAERHGGGARLEVTWRCEGRSADLSLVLTPGAAGSGDHPLISTADLSALRERAASIGATVALEPGQGRSTRVRCSLTGRPEGSEP
jgi:signal transduction histidine kinase